MTSRRFRIDDLTRFRTFAALFLFSTALSAILESRDFGFLAGY
jgi:hypothetical protein